MKIKIIKKQTTAYFPFNNHKCKIAKVKSMSIKSRKSGFRGFKGEALTRANFFKNKW